MVSFSYDALVPAAGEAARFGTDKITKKIGSVTVIEAAVRPFLDDPFCRAVIVLAGKNADVVARLFAQVKKVTVIFGGANRAETVKKGLAAVGADYVLVHDGARPYLSSLLLQTVLTALRSAEAVVPVVRPNDSVIRAENGLLCYADRTALWMVQTPQGFVTARLKEAFGLVVAGGLKGAAYGDEGSVYLAAFGAGRMALVDGDPANRKITHPADLPPAI